MFEIKWKRLNSNDWAARETILGRRAKHSAYTGWLSCCPHASVRRGGAKRYGAIWCVRSSSNPTAEGRRPRQATPARLNPNAAGGGRRGITGAQERVGEAANNKVDDGEPPGTGSFSWGGSNRWLPSSPVAAGSGEIPAKRCSPSFGNGVERSVRRGE